MRLPGHSEVALAVALTLVSACGDDGGGESSGPSPWEPGVTWQYQLDGTIDTSVDAQLFDVDLFDTPVSTVEALHAAGADVVCYLSAGSWEEWRPDADEFPAEVIGNDYDGWPGERWLDIRDLDALGPILEARLDLCVDKGFEGVEPDNVDGYQQDTGFDITEDDQLAFNRWLADAAHERGLTILLKNDPEQADDLVDDFDAVLTEECADQGWCDEVDVFVDRGKPVLQVEYADTDVDFDAVCTDMAEGYSPILKDRDLDGSLEACA